MAVCLLGNGNYGIEGTPVMFGWFDWLENNGIQLDSYLEENAQAVAGALETVLYGGSSQREKVESAIEAMPEDQKKTWLGKYNNERRTSLVDLVSKAQRIAAHLREEFNVEVEG